MEATNLESSDPDRLQLENDPKVREWLTDPETGNISTKYQYIYIETIIFSALYYYKLGLIKKWKIICVTNKKIYLLGRTHRRIETHHKITDLYAITISLLQDNSKYILHFKNLGDREVKCLL